MRLFALFLLMLNLALFGWLRGMFGERALSGREPARLELQIAAERIRVLTDRDVQQLRRRASDSGAATQIAAPAAEASQCVEIGDFTGDGALARFRARLAELKLGDKSIEQTRELVGWYPVLLAGLKSRAETEQRIEELRAQGERDPLILQAATAPRFTIQLGVFRDRELARKHLASLERRGIKGARVADSATAVQSTRVRVRGIDAGAAAQLDEAQKDFPQQKLQACGNDAAP